MRARRASGGREGDLIKRAAKLRERVDPLLPKLTAGVPTERFDRLRAALEAVRELKEDARALEKASRWGAPLVRAYAGLLKFYLDPELPAVIVLPLPGGDVSYAPLNRAPKEAHVAVQQYDEPRRLLLGYLDWARKGFHFYTTKETLWCTGRDATPPPDVRAAQIAELPYRVAELEGGRRIDCPHLAADEPVPFLRVGWPAAGTEVRICRRCAKSNRQLLASLTTGTAVPKPDAAFPVDVQLNVDCHGGADCVHRQLPPLARGLRKRYQFGRLADSELIAAYVDSIRPRLEGVRTPVFVAGGHCYGADASAFLGALHPTTEERKALEEVLPSVGGLFEVDEASASRALERLWPDHAESIVRAIVPDRARAERLVREAKAAPGRVSELLKRAAEETRQAEVLSALPQYESLSREATFVDGVVRAFHRQGARQAERLLLQTLPREGKERGLAYGLLLALGQGSAHRWQFTDTEQQFGASLESLAKAAFASSSGDYHSALGALLGAAGVTGWGTAASQAP